MSDFPETIFYRPRPRDEDALSYAFLAFIEHLEKKTLNKLLKKCGIGGLILKPDFETIFQPIFGNGSRPDGIIMDDSQVVCFENKVDQSHSDEQLSRYFKQMQLETKEMNHYMLVGIDTSIQSPLVTKSILDRTEIPEDSVFILAWQDLLLGCKTLVETSKDELTEVEIFLLDEFVLLLEEMDMVPYTNLTSDDLKGFSNTRSQLSTLQNYLNQEIPRLIPQLQLYNKRNSYANIFADLLGFQFKGASGDGYSYVYLYMDEIENFWGIGIDIEEVKDRKKLRKNMDLEALIAEFERIGTYQLRCGYNKAIEVEPADIREFVSENNEQLEEHFEIFRTISFEELAKEYRLETAEFPRKITEEILKLGRFIELISSILQAKK